MRGYLINVLLHLGIVGSECGHVEARVSRYASIGVIMVNLGVNSSSWHHITMKDEIQSESISFTTMESCAATTPS